MDFFGADAHTRLAIPPAFLIGAGTASHVTQIDTAQTVITVHFRPGGARTLFARFDALSAPGSILLYDVVGKMLLEAPSLEPLLKAMAQQGSPWLFGTGEPGELAERLGWSADGSDVPRGYFVEAQR